ncbi:hypothetical protein [Gloeobacter violaceus]|uniref:Glr3276 protein n=1 Tax=Gloeobacter violaceus (strain ATCC 29082 / PCC 7421) TaxID=251221 RepID=Q7NG97_GLOVI|nr:hypothetical protein [Gloeobacter violaceus]BAC91217.1 glr3276 [Gloeobacter violaceus PCC 7421]
MASRWNPQPTPSHLHPEVRALVGEYGARALGSLGIGDPQSARAFLWPERSPLGHCPTWPELERAAQWIAQTISEGKSITLQTADRFESAVAALLLQEALREAGTELTVVAGAQPVAQSLLIAVGSMPAAPPGCRTIAIEARLGEASGEGLVALNALQLALDHPLRFLPEAAVAWMLVEALLGQLNRQPPPDRWADLLLAGCVAGLVSLAHCRPQVLAGLAQDGGGSHPLLAALISSHRRQIFKMAAPLDALGARATAWLAGESDGGWEPLWREHEARIARVVQEGALAIESLGLQSQGVAVLARVHWPRQALSLAAARLAGRYGLAVVLIACPEAEALAHGSGYAPEGTDLIAALAALRPLWVEAGGRPEAVRLVCESRWVAALQRELGREIARRVARERLEPPVAIAIDAETTLDLPAELDRAFHELERLAPFGPGRPRPRVAVRNYRPQWTLSRDGRHLECKIGPRTLRLRDGAEERARRQEAGLMELIFEMEPWEANLWWGRLHAVQPAEARPALPAEAGRQIQVEDFRRMGATLPDALPALILREWPLCAEELSVLLRQSPWSTVVLAGRSRDWSRVHARLPVLVQRWEQGERLPEALADSELPEPVVVRIVARCRAGGAVARAACAVLREASAFQRWLDAAPAAEIARLCNRLVQDG